ncbi:MAG: FtsW/RodA/SpoVE family cell cycle protein, partial [Spirochaetaceae bacterium]|nr:FtsW/RodA/SpoVE family cell cycle protein [Spirochaetaceae bacterium]
MLGAILILAGAGIAALWSASAGYALSIGKESHYFALRQALFLLPAAAIFVVCAGADLDAVRRRMGAVTLVGFAVLLLPFLPFLGETRNGATRWIDLGFTTFQPSELWKVISLFYLAHVLDKRAARIAESPGVLIPPFLLIAMGALSVYAQNDFSTAVVVGASAVLLFWAAGSPPSFFLGLGAAAAPLATLSILTSDFRLKRVLAFLFPAYEPHGQGYQVLGSLRAIRSGGLAGKGIGLGTLKLASIPEVQSDFVLAAWAEETGFIGVLAVMAAWAVLAWRAFGIAYREEDRFRSYLGFGLVSLLSIEVLVNAAVVAGAVPATGIA